MEFEIDGLKRRVGDIEKFLKTGGIVTDHTKELDRHLKLFERVDTRTEKMQKDITHLRTDVTTMQGDITHLRTDVTTMQGDIT
ncbi:hypothetical protein, partial [Nonomuraea coxensis]